MKLISWNVNGLRSILTKGLEEYIYQEAPDIFCLQETKMQEGQVDVNFWGYEGYFNSADKKGYSGTAVFTKKKPIKVTKGIGIDEHDHEGRVLTLEFEEFYLVNVYTPNSKQELERLSYRMKWEDDFRNYLLSLKKEKPVIMCGDLNVAHEEIDLKNPKTNHHSAGFTDQEREKISTLLASGFIDTFRYLHPDTIKYSWWSYMMKARVKNIGWRIDYFIVSEDIKEKIIHADIDSEILGSDHCPVKLEVDF